MVKKTINYFVCVQTLPKDLTKPLRSDQEHLSEASDLYQMAIDTKILWPVWKIDQYGHHWIGINLLGQDRSAEMHSLALDEGTFIKVEFEAYEIDFEIPI